MQISRILKLAHEEFASDNGKTELLGTLAITKDLL